MKLEIHQKAKDNFNSKIEELKLKLQYRDFPKQEQINVNSNTHIAGEINRAAIIGEMKYFWHDDSGRIEARAFRDKERLLGLFDEDYKELARIAEGMQKAISPKNVIGTEKISELIFEWIKEKYRGEDISGMVEFVLAETENEISEFEIWIPISHLFIGAPFSLGKITFKAITKKMMDEYEESWLSKVPNEEDRQKIHFKFEQKRSQMQSLAVATIKVKAESQKAYETALEEAEKAVSILRFYSPIILHPNKICYVAPLGKQHMDSNYYFFVEDGKFTTYHSGFSDNLIEHWNLPKNKLAELMKAGLKILSDLLNQETLTDFQRKLLDGIFLFTKGILAKGISDRLVYIFVALETVFLKDNSEYIQDNVSLRMAYLQPEVAKRKDIISNFKATYKLRSSIVHHGANIGIDELETLKVFMANAWESLQFLVVFLANTKITREQFFEDLENRRIGG